MPHQNSVFHSVLKSMPWGEFDRAVERHAADKHVRTLTTRTQFVALTYGQLSKASSMRALASSFASHAQRLYHLGVQPVARSSLSDANARRPEAVFAAVFAALVARAQPALARRMAECVLLIDSTTVRLSRLSESWARFSADRCGVKAHVVYDAAAESPVYLAVTPQRTNDITVAQAMPIQPGATPGATYVFDLGYYDYAWWAELHDAGCRIVTRLKANTPLAVETERMIEPGELATDSAIILSDRTGTLPARQTNRRQNPMHHLVREVRVRIETGKVLRLLTNDLTASARKIADLYKQRWAVELFFRWVKQTLNMTRFIGRSENAVRIHIAVALITYLLLRITQTTYSLLLSPLRFAGLVRDNLMHRKTLQQVVQPDLRPPIPLNLQQGLLLWP